MQAGTQSTTLQAGTQSTTLQAGTQSTTLQAGTQSTMLQTGTNSTLLQGGTAGSLIQAAVQREGGPANVLFLVDASFSMKEKLPSDGEKEPKMSVAKKVLQSALYKVPQDVNLGLRVFGQQFLQADPYADCHSTALLVPLGQHNRGAIHSRVEEIKPFGMTPLEYALRQAAEDDFRGVQGAKTIILITDGADTCGGNPCAFISRLPLFGIKMKVDVVGVDLKRDPTARAQLHCIAETSGGKYYDANTAAEMVDSISKSVNGAVSVSGRVIMRPSSPTNTKNTETPPELIPIEPIK